MSILAKNHSIKAILFDVDNTLIDHQYSVRCGMSVIQDLHPALKRVSIEELEGIYEQISRDTHDDLVINSQGRIDARASRFATLLSRYNVTLNSYKLRNASELYQQIYDGTTTLIPGVQKLLEVLKTQYNLGIVTNSSSEKQKHRLTVCGIQSFFEFIIAGKDEGVYKPNPEIYYKALNLAHTDALETVFIGDSWAHDVVGPMKIGIHPIWFNRFGDLENPTYSHQVRSLAKTGEIMGMILSLR